MFNLQKYFCVFCIGDDIKEVLRQDVERVWIVQGKDQDGGLGIFVVAGRNAGNPLHATGVPQLLNIKKLISFANL